MTLQIGHVAEGSMTVQPWPFDVDRLEYEVPCRRLPATPYTSDYEFQQAFNAAPRDTLHVRLIPG
jgi:hypothetical protein